MGKESERRDWEAKMNEAKLEIAQLQAQAAEINTTVITEFYPQIRYIDKVEQQIVTEFVTIKADNECTINNGFVRLHDSVVSQSIIASDPTDSEAQELKLSEVSSTVKENYQTCHRNAVQLKSLQDWIIKQEKLWNTK